MDAYIKFDGRIRRMGWWICGIITGILTSIVQSIRDSDSLWLITLIFGVLALVTWVFEISVSVRRWHDLNKSGWWVLINLIPILGWIYTIFMLGFMPGDQGTNAYGPPPKEGAILN